jgi:hypothetical protein
MLTHADVCWRVLTCADVCRYGKANTIPKEEVVSNIFVRGKATYAKSAEMFDGTHLTCVTSTRVQILTQEEARSDRRRAAQHQLRQQGEVQADGAGEQSAHGGAGRIVWAQVLRVYLLY